MPRPSKREQLLAGATEHLFAHGYGASSVQDLARAAHVPKGTFHNHFASKEAFAVAALDRYFEDLSAVVEKHLGRGTRRPLARLRAYFNEIAANLEAVDWTHGCLIGTLSAELADHSELVRAALHTVYARWSPAFTDCIKQAQAAGEVRMDLPPEVLADFLLDAWEGALLRMRVEHSGVPLRRFRKVVFSALLMPAEDAAKRNRA